MDREKELFTRRQFLKKNIFLMTALAFLGFPLRDFGETFRKGPDVSDKEARFYSTLAG